MPLYNPAPPIWGYQTQYWYHPQGATGATQTIVQANATYAPIIVPVPRIIDQIGLEFTVAGTTNSVTRLGIYNDLNGLPGSLILDAGTVPSSCTAAVQTISISQALGPGVYWVACVGQGSPGTQPTVRRLGSDNAVVGLSTPSVGTGFVNGYNQTGVTSNLPSSASITSASGGASLVMLRAQ